MQKLRTETTKEKKIKQKYFLSRQNVSKKKKRDPVQTVSVQKSIQRGIQLSPGTTSATSSSSSTASPSAPTTTSNWGKQKQNHSSKSYQ